AQAIGHGDAIYVHEPPFAWHPERSTPWDAPRHSNVCRGEHAVRMGQVDGVPAHTCARCPFYWVPDSAFTSDGVRMPFDPSRVRTEIVPVPGDVAARSLVDRFPFLTEPAL